MSSLDPSLSSNAAPILASGAAGAVNDHIVNAPQLETNLTSDAIEQGAQRNIGLENAEKQADALVKGHENGMTPEERNQRVMTLMNALSRTNPAQGASPQVAQEAAETMKRLIKAVMKIIKAMFGKGDPENDADGNSKPEPIWMIGRTGGASGYGPLHDQLLEMMSKKGDEFENSERDATKKHEAALDKDGLDSPAPGQSLKR